jgi:hypothetical protein
VNYLKEKRNTCVNVLLAVCSGMETIETMKQLEKQRRFIGVTIRALCAHMGVTPKTYIEWRKKGTSLRRLHEVRQSLRHFASKYK